MVPPQIPAHVLQFLTECVDSVPQLEALLIMFAEPLRRWNAQDISARTYVALPEATRILDRLSRRDLVRSDDTGSHFLIHLGDDARRALIGDVARTYQANLRQVATFIHEKPPASLTEFARAFDLKRDH
jgi:hypothetical protein